MKGKLIVIEGTNASGKSALGIRMAKEWNGEIVSADSRQVYARMDLGSGKVTEEERNGVPHHLLDVRQPGEFFSMADFQALAYGAIEDILARGKQPFLVGGTGLYVDSVTEGYVLSDKKPDAALRARLETLSTPELYARLKAVQPDTEVDPKNRHRVMRLLEKIAAGDGGPAPRQPRYEVLKFGVTWPREELKRRIDERLERRLRQGMTEEVRALLDEGVPEEFLVKLGLEYKYLTWYLTGKMSYEQMTEELARAIKRFAKRQMTWFRKDPDIIWLDMAGDPLAQARPYVEAFLAGKAEETEGSGEGKP